MLAGRAPAGVNSLRKFRAMPEAVTLESRGAAALITIDRQERRNAIDGPTAELLTEAYRAFVADDDARVLVITGAGELAFCAGADLKAIESFGPRLELPDGPLGFSRLISPKPTIAAISGWCLAGGLELALWCDLRIVTEDAKLGFTERRFGVPLIDGGTQRLPRIVGLGRALDMILTGRIVEAEEAERIGLVTEMVGPGLHLERALEMAEALARFPQDTMLADRSAALEGIGLTFEEGMRLESRSGQPTQATAWAGASRFAAGEGRGGAGAGV
jgi:enoyl-CoA hydratase